MPSHFNTTSALTIPSKTSIPAGWTTPAAAPSANENTALSVQWKWHPNPASPAGRIHIQCPHAPRPASIPFETLPDRCPSPVSARANRSDIPTAHMLQKTRTFRRANLPDTVPSVELLRWWRHTRHALPLSLPAPSLLSAQCPDCWSFPPFPGMFHSSAGFHPGIVAMPPEFSRRTPQCNSSAFSSCSRLTLLYLSVLVHAAALQSFRILFSTAAPARSTVVRKLLHLFSQSQTLCRLLSKLPVSMFRR